MAPCNGALESGYNDAASMTKEEVVSAIIGCLLPVKSRRAWLGEKKQGGKRRRGKKGIELQVAGRVML